MQSLTVLQRFRCSPVDVLYNFENRRTLLHSPPLSTYNLLSVRLMNEPIHPSQSYIEATFKTTIKIITISIEGRKNVSLIYHWKSLYSSLSQCCNVSLEPAYRIKRIKYSRRLKNLQNSLFSSHLQLLPPPLRITG